jgi:hypothetical protein
MIWGYSKLDGWHYAEKWGYYQRTEGRVVAYIERYFGFYRVHVTTRGNLGVCDIEYRNEDFDVALKKALELLDKYKNSEKSDLHKDYYSPNNIEGYWHVEYPNRYKNGR